jgi:hypothetical protein
MGFIIIFYFFLPLCHKKYSKLIANQPLCHKTPIGIEFEKIIVSDADANKR